MRYRKVVTDCCRQGEVRRVGPSKIERQSVWWRSLNHDTRDRADLIGYHTAKPRRKKGTPSASESTEQSA